MKYSRHTSPHYKMVTLMRAVTALEDAKVRSTHLKERKHVEQAGCFCDPVECADRKVECILR